jgi:hypothetical protein
MTARERVTASTFHLIQLPINSVGESLFKPLLMSSNSQQAALDPPRATKVSSERRPTRLRFLAEGCTFRTGGLGRFKMAGVVETPCRGVRW